MPSYSPVFSSGLIYYTGATPNTAFEVPAGFTAVVRDVSVYSGVGEVNLSLYVQLSDADPAVYVIGLNTTGANVSAHWEGRIVVGAGGTITIDIGELGYYDGAYVGGYLLRNSLS